MITSLSTGRITAAKLDALLKPYDYITGRAPVIYAHGLDGQAYEATGSNVPSVQKVLRRVIDFGFTIAAPTTDNTWGNSTGQQRVTSAVSWCRLQGAHATKKAVLIGTSHGGTSVLAWARANLTATAGIVLMLPSLDLEYLRQQDIVEGFALRASIDAAHGVTYPTPLPSNVSPLSFASQLADIPILLFYASDDDISHNYASFASAHGDTTLVGVGALGHSDASIAAVDIDTVAEFINQYG